MYVLLTHVKYAYKIVLTKQNMTPDNGLTLATGYSNLMTTTSQPIQVATTNS